MGRYLFLSLDSIHPESGTVLSTVYDGSSGLGFKRDGNIPETEKARVDTRQEHTRLFLCESVKLYPTSKESAEAHREADLLSKS